MGIMQKKYDLLAIASHDNCRWLLLIYAESGVINRERRGLDTFAWLEFECPVLNYLNSAKHCLYPFYSRLKFFFFFFLGGGG